MTKLLLKIFLKNADPSNPKSRQKYGTFTTVVCIIINVCLAVCKLIIGLLTGSIAIQADAINNFSDSGTSVISFVSFKISGKPADRDHPFGHARIEYIASMIVSFIIIVIGVNLLRDSIDKIINPEPTEFSIVSVIILGGAILAKLWMAVFNKTVGNIINSEVLRATAADSISDVISTSAVLATTLVLRFTGFDADAYVGILVALFILFAGLKVLNETKNSILGEAPVEEDVKAIKEIVFSFPEALGVHDMMVHNYGPGHTVASLHVEVDGDKNVFESHDAIDNMEKRIYEELGILCTIHLDPIETSNADREPLLKIVMDAAKHSDPDMSVHDFRFVKGTTHTNLIFDIVLPFENHTPPDEVRKQISAYVKKEHPDYNCVITVDRG